MIQIAPGTTSQSITFRAYDSTTGAPVTVTSATAGIAASYSRFSTAGVRISGPTSISLSNLASATASYSSGGIIVVNATSGEHRLDIPDAALATGADRVRVTISSTNETLVVSEIMLGDLRVDVQPIARSLMGASAVYYVDRANGSDSNNGLAPATPKKTLAAAEALASAGAVIVVMPGKIIKVGN